MKAPCVCRAISVLYRSVPGGGRGAHHDSLFSSSHYDRVRGGRGHDCTSACAGLFLCRAAVGLGEGVAPSASTDMLARLVDTRERSRATSYMFGGLHVGSLLGLLVAPALIETFGWQTVRHAACASTPPRCHSPKTLFVQMHLGEPTATKASMASSFGGCTWLLEAWSKLLVAS